MAKIRNTSFPYAPIRYLAVGVVGAFALASLGGTCEDQPSGSAASTAAPPKEGEDARCQGALVRPDCADGESVVKTEPSGALGCAPCGQGAPPSLSDKICFNGQLELLPACFGGKVLVVQNRALACAECPGGILDAGADAAVDAKADAAGEEALCVGCANGPGCPPKAPVAGADCPNPDTQCFYCTGGDTSATRRFTCLGTWQSGTPGACN